MVLLDDEFEFFFEKAWSNGLPVVPPTEERIERMLSGTKRSPEEVLGVIPPAFEEVTVQSAAVHAVMAGCKPEYMPVVIAGIETIADERLNTTANQVTMRGGAPLMVVNGPTPSRLVSTEAPVASVPASARTPPSDAPFGSSSPTWAGESRGLHR